MHFSLPIFIFTPNKKQLNHIHNNTRVPQMNDVLENKLSMYIAVAAYLKENTSIIAPVTALTEALNNFNSIIQQIKEKELLRKTSTAGKAKIKNQLKQKLVNSTLVISSAIFAYASSTKNLKLKAIADLNKRKITNSRDTAIVGIADIIKTTADSISAELTAYGITAPQLTELQNLKEQYDSSIGSTANSLSTKTTAGKILPTHFKQADLLLKEQLDKIMEKFSSSDKQFYTGYKNVRKIIDN